MGKTLKEIEDRAVEKWVFDATVYNAYGGAHQSIWMTLDGKRTWTGRSEMAKWRNLSGRRVRVTVEVLESATEHVLQRRVALRKMTEDASAQGLYDQPEVSVG